MPVPTIERKDRLEEIYQEAIRPLAPSERLQLATRILNDIPPECVVDYSEEWSDEDLRDFSRASWEYVNRGIEEEAQPRD